MKKANAVTGISLLAMSLGCVSPLHAQTVSAKTETDEVGDAGEASEDKGEGGAIVVTGSRIARDGYSLPTPTVVSTAEQLELTSPQNLTQGLNKLPAFAGSQGQQGSGQGALGSGGVNGIGSFLNLRNFGTIRTLILLDGRRVPATNFDGNVDVDTLPQALIQRVDVVTGGASAVYGSDAVTGVVNYVLDRKFSGIKGTAQAGISDYGDSASQRLNLAFGTPLFGGRGHLLLSGEFNNNDGVATRESRPWYQDQLSTGSGTAASPVLTVINGRDNTRSFGGLIRRTSTINATLPSSLANMTFNPDGTLRPFDNGAPTNTASRRIGGDGTYFPEISLLASLETKQAFARFEYELSDDLTVFAQGNYSDSYSRHTQAIANRSDTSSNQIVIFSGNAYLRPEIQAILTANNSPSFILSQSSIDAGRPIFDITTRSYQALVGLEGRIGGFNWDATFTHGEGRTLQDQLFNSNNMTFAAAVDAVRDPATGNIVCRVTLTSPGLFPGCVPINVLGRGNASQAAIDYTTDTTGWTAINKSDSFAANITGDLFDTWAGPVSIAVGGEYRKQSLVQTTTNSPLTVPDFTGLRGGFSSATLTHVGVLVSGARGSNEVWELNGETIVPLLRDSALGETLDVSGAARYTHYSNSGGVTTWKVGLDYQPISDLRFRLVASRDIRAPTLFDLFAATQIRNLALNDPLTGVASTTQQVQGGNPDLVPEVAKTYTAGVVFSPSALPGFDISIDYFNISINNAIGSVALLTQIRECTASGGTSPFCANITRPFPITNTTPANFPTRVFDGAINAAVNKTAGVDIQVGYRTTLDGVAPDSSLGVRVLASYQPTLKRQGFSGGTVLDFAGVADEFSKWRVTTEINLKLGAFNAIVLNRWKSAVTNSADPSVIFADPAPGAYNITDMTLTAEIPAYGGKFQPFLTVSNLFNRAPRIFASRGTGQTTPVVAGDDVLGRYFTAGVRFRF